MHDIVQDEYYNCQEAYARKKDHISKLWKTFFGYKICVNMFLN